MAAAPPNVTRRFLPWDRPLLPQAVSWLASDWDRSGPLDLSRDLVLVPTRQAGRRLREALAVLAGGSGRAAFPPAVLTPEGWLNSMAQPGASRLESVVAWAETLRSAPLDEFRDVFPEDPPARPFSWGMRLAQQLLALQSTLAQNGCRLGDIGGRAEADGNPEAPRWRQLGELERRYDERLARAGLRDTQARRIEAAADPRIGPDVRRIVLVGTPDPAPLAVAALSRLADRGLPVDVVVFAPEAEAAGFDPWGRPATEAWALRPLGLPHALGRVQLEANPEGQARRAAELAAAGAAVGIVDPELFAPLEAELRRRRLAAFNPEGRPRRMSGLYHLLAALAELAREDSFVVVQSVARQPDFLAFAGHRLGPRFSPARWLAGLDELQARHLPVDLDAARSHAPAVPASPELAMGLALIDELRRELNAGGFAEDVQRVLSELFSGRTPDGTPPAPPELQEDAAAWMEVLAGWTELHAPLARDEAWDLALRLFGEQIRPTEKEPGSVELQGWLELLWEDAPRLIVAGFNDGRVPESVSGDLFLPEALRERLGLTSNAVRFARDAYVLQALAASRPAGRLDLVYGKYSAAGDPLRPSRLLLACPDEELPGRVKALFRDPPPSPASPAWTRAWRLCPPRPALAGVPTPPAGSTVNVPRRISATALRRWLQCPFRFYLHEVLGMEAVDPDKAEMDAMDFGTLCHAVLEAMGREPALAGCADARALREFLLDELDRQVARRFGRKLALPLVVQTESARQRLRRVAEVQAAEHAAGWRIQDVEHKLELTVGGLVIAAKIDRIDRHEGSGAVRVLDYKTTDSGIAPVDAHLRTPRRGETPPEWRKCVLDGKDRVWSDLQLPLYRWALAREFPRLAGTGYFNLPKAAADAGIVWWEPYPGELQDSAIRCAEGVCAAIRRGEFWPPSEGLRPEEDPYAELFHRGAAASVEWTGVAVP